MTVWFLCLIEPYSLKVRVLLFEYFSHRITLKYSYNQLEKTKILQQRRGEMGKIGKEVKEKCNRTGGITEIIAETNTFTAV